MLPDAAPNTSIVIVPINCAGLATNTTPTNNKSTTANTLMNALTGRPKYLPARLGIDAPPLRTLNIPQK